MSNLINHSLLSKKDDNKNDIPQKSENENRFLLDIQLLSSLKSIPGKIIPLSNKINDVTKTNKENNNDKNNKNETNNKIIYNNNNKSIFTPIDKLNNNNNYINNTYTTNNIFFNNGINNTNVNINLNNNNGPNGLGAIQEHYNFLENPLLFSPSNHPSFLSIKSDIKNNNFIWTDNKFTQNSFHFQNFMIYNGNYNQNENYNNINKNNNLNSNLNNIINNNIKFSQLSYQHYNLGNEELLKRKRSTPLLFLKDSEINNIPNNNIINSEKKNSLLVLYKANDNSKKENNEEKEKNYISFNNNKKILFNVENYSEEFYEEDDDNIYHNINNNKLDNNNLFNCYHKIKKRKRKNNEIRKYKCVHPYCEYSYKTLKQLQNHHFKMISECQLDSVQILKLIYNTKIMLINLIKKDKKKKEYYTKLYENSINNISLDNYSEFITGTHFDDKI